MADTPFDMFYLPFRPALDANGVVVPGASLTFYTSGTNILQTVYADAALTIPLANPLTANAAGVWPSIYIDNSLIYRVVLRDGDGGVLDEADPYVPGAIGGPKGDTGSADNTYPDKPSLAASDITRDVASLKATSDQVGTRYYWTTGDFTGRTDVIVSTFGAGVPISQGAWVPQVADGVSYTLPAQAAQPQSQSDKNAQTVDFFDALTPAMRASVNSGNLAVDCSPALNAITTFAYGGESQGDATGGTTLFIKGGRYRLNSPIKNTYRRDNAIVDDGDLRRLNIQGDGSNSTALFYFGPAGSPAIETAGYRGTTVNDGVKLRQKISGIWLRRWPISSKTGIGMQVSHAEGMMLDDVIVDGFEINMLATDVLEFYARQVFFKDCVVGVRMQLSDFTNPNVIEFNGGGISGATALGMHLVRPANAVVKGGFRAEGNGFDANFQLFLIELGTPEGTFSFRLCDSYLENNMGSASVTLAHGYASDAVVEIKDNTIHNDSATRFMQHHVDYARFGAAASAGNYCVLKHDQAYKNIGTYVSDPSRSAVRLQTPGAIFIDGPGSRYPSDNERPETNGFTTIGTCYPVLRANVAANGTYDPNPLTSLNVQSITKTGTGTYRILYKTMPRQPLNVHVSIEQNNGFGFSTFVRASTYVDVLTTDATGNPTDRAFSILVQGDYP